MVVGVGKVGYQVIRGLHEMRESIVAIEMAAGAPFLGELFDRGIPVIQGNARMSSVLEQAGVREARAVIVTTSDDLTANLDAAITARELERRRPDRPPPVRRDPSRPKVAGGVLHADDLDVSGRGKPAFIAAATGRKIYQALQLAGQEVHLTDIVVCPTGRLVGRTVGEIQADKRINVVMYQCSRTGAVNVNPNPGRSC